MQAENLRLYERLSVAGLLGDLHDTMKAIRPTISRNTIRLAFVRGGTTRLRRRILQEGQTLWEQHRADEAKEITQQDFERPIAVALH